MKYSLLIWFLIFCLCLGGIFLFSRCVKEDRLPSELPPDFTLVTLDGQEVTLSRLRGKVVVLDFWATWCEPCKESIPHFIRLHQKYRKNGLELIGMNMDKGDVKLVRDFIKSKNIPYPVVMASEEVVRNYRVTGIPVSVLIDKNGKIRERILGYNNALSRQMIATIETLLSEEKTVQNNNGKSKE